ncbi:filamentous hemagglutinin N-terminal domain-containing protein [Leptolyngbya sp. CCNP1308]|uniref:two-partner secretion domain-containing protein n=1 Tax=Leptolyngbya sp. CCNP1308 TaxID=3110255 RepID=UPI002B200B33|nr:filamentous hemagglutinin N-terminal domain-containing protein [Leptolyngbya sp. CCNP1308]MEA5449381.1 filamentous hemagglutinin N-terminal domain-containing protein [Leptolyngbya sp. CCNP1308]
MLLPCRPWLLAGSIVPWLSLVATLPALAQITPDATLGPEASVVAPGVQVRGDFADLIEGGAIRGSNLFHSFLEFNVDPGQRVYFANPAGIESIFSRVTGSDLSNILGVLGIDGAANLFLINPNGLIFGENASLDLRGSFVGTTAGAVQFGDQGLFSTTSPEAPSQLLSIDPSAFLFNQLGIGSIENRSRAAAGRDPSNTFDAFGLRVPEGNSLILLGGDINLLGGGLVAFGGRVELGSLTAAGTVGLTLDTDTPSLVFPENIARANVSLAGDSGIIVAGNGGGDVTIYAQDINIIEGSSIEAGILPGFGSIDTLAGDIVLNATRNIVTSNAGSSLYNYVSSNSLGNSGNIIIDASEIRIQDGSEIATYVAPGARGNSGNIQVQTIGLAEVIGNSPSGSPSFLGTVILLNAGGTAGNLMIKASQIRIQDGGVIASQSRGFGDTGYVDVNASDFVEVTGSRGLNSNLGTNIFRGAEGNAGNLNIQTERVRIDSSQISTSIQGRGSAGDLVISASESVTVRGEIFDQNGVAMSPAGIFSQVDVDAQGQGGNLTIETRNLSISDGGKVQVGTFGIGSAGNLVIRASQIDVFDDARLRSRFRTGIFGGVLQDPNSTIFPIGNGGSITIYANRLSIRDGARVTADVSGIGIGGDIFIQANDLLEIVGSSRRFTPSNLGSTVNPPAINTPVSPEEIIGRGGNLTIQAGRLSIREGGTASVATFGNGDAGNIIIQNTQSVEIIGQTPNNTPSSMQARVGENGTGSGGNIIVDARQLTLIDGAEITSRSEGTGNAGNITFNIVPGTIRITDSVIQASATQASGGAITINADNIQLFGDADIRTEVTNGSGGGGSITIAANFLIALDDSDILAFSADGQGGNIDLSRTTFFGQNANVASGRLSREELLALDGNNRVDINATGGVESGQISIGDASFIENSLTSLEDTIIDTTSLTAGSCIARTDESLGSFTATGSGGLPQRPGDNNISVYPTGTVRTAAEPTAALQEPDGVYRLPDGRLVLSRSCD